MYETYAAKMGLEVEDLDFTPGNAGGFKTITFRVSGDKAFGLLKYEHGGHKIQRISPTDSKKRMHTSMASVYVRPEREEPEIVINKADTKTETFSAGGPGGQNVNKNECAVRVTHIPTGISVTSRAKSQARNLKYCWQMLGQRIAEKQREEAFNREKKERDTTGRGARNQRIRVYNFPQNRVTDYRTNKDYSLDRVLKGELPTVGEI